jgi:hypothetical protein
VFSLTPAATVDEGNNWINVTWGPLSLSNPAVQGTDGNWGGGAALGNYALQATSPAVDYVPQNGNTFVVPQLQSSDFFGNPRPDPSMPKKFDVGAVEYQGKVAVPVLSSINPPTGSRGSTNLAITIYGSNLGNATGLTGLGSGVSVAPGTFSASASQITALLNITNTAPLGIRNIGITTINGINGNTVAFTVQGATVQIIVPTNMVTSPANRNAKDGTVTVNNTATGPTAGPLTLTALPTIARASGTGTFTIIGGTCTSGYVVNPGASCTITVHYVPPAAPANPSSTAQVTIYDTGTPSTSQKSSTFTAN